VSALDLAVYDLLKEISLTSEVLTFGPEWFSVNNAVNNEQDASSGLGLCNLARYIGYI
jgi:hypothetical protein